MSLLSDKNATQKRNSKKSKGQKSSKELIQWTSNHKNIVLEFINEPKSPNVIPYSDFSKPFVVNFDVSEKGLGAVLYQKLDGMKKL